MVFIWKPISATKKNKYVRESRNYEISHYYEISSERKSIISIIYNNLIGIIISYLNVYFIS